jgi:hypothetical protein
LGIDHSVDVSAAARRNAGALSRRAVLRSCLFAGAALPLAGCWGDGTVVKRIKVIAKAEVDGKIVEGSSVTELKWRPRGDGGMDSDGVGEAVVLELSGKGTVFVLPMVLFDDGWDTFAIWSGQVQNAAGIKGGVHKEDLEKISALQGQFSFFPMVKGASNPVIVAFKNESEFRSVYRVLPEDFSKHFGAGVRFVGVKFEVTDDPVTDGVLAKRLPMLLRRAKGATDEEITDSNGNRLSYKDKPFRFKIGTIDFFDKERF